MLSSVPADQGGRPLEHGHGGRATPVAVLMRAGTWYRCTDGSTNTTPLLSGEGRNPG